MGCCDGHVTGRNQVTTHIVQQTDGLNEQWRTQEFFFREGGLSRDFFRGRGVSTNSVEDRGHKDRDSGGISPLVSETRNLIRLLRMYFPRNWEFGSAF
jgi:hypothetical protein